MNIRSLKYFIKSKSFSFSKDLSDHSHRVGYILWNGQKVYYRASTSDMSLIYRILLQSKYKSEYFFPSQLKPNVIFDIGGNIGVTAIYLASLFPDAKIYTFEPLPENYQLLKSNVKNYKNIEAFNFGLGSKSGDFKVYLSNDSKNFGGASFFPDPIGNEEKSYINCKVKNINDFCNFLFLE